MDGRGDAERPPEKPPATCWAAPRPRGDHQRRPCPGEVREAGGPATVAWDLGSINQNFAQSLAVADNVPARDAWLLVGVNLGALAPDRGSSSSTQSEGREFLLKS